MNGDTYNVVLAPAALNPSRWHRAPLSWKESPYECIAGRNDGQPRGNPIYRVSPALVPGLVVQTTIPTTDLLPGYIKRISELQPLFTKLNETPTLSLEE